MRESDTDVESLDKIYIYKKYYIKEIGSGH